MTPELKKESEEAFEKWLMLSLQSRPAYHPSHKLVWQACLEHFAPRIELLQEEVIRQHDVMIEMKREIARLDAVLCASAMSGKPAPLSERNRDRAADAYTPTADELPCPLKMRRND